MGDIRTRSPEPVSPGFGQRVYDLTVAKRRSNGRVWTATDLAKAMGVTPAAVRAYFGGTVPRGKNLSKLANALGVDVGQLLSPDDSPAKGPDQNEAERRLVRGSSDHERPREVLRDGAPTRRAESDEVPSEADTPDSVMAAYQRWVAKYYVTGMSVPAAVATQWMVRMWQAESGGSSESAAHTAKPFSPGNSEAAALVGPEGEILAVSDTLCEMLGVKEDEVIGIMGCEFAASEEDAELLRQSMLCPLKTPTDLTMKNSSGQKLAVTAYPTDEKGDALQVTFLRRGVLGDTTTEELPGILVATMDGRIVLVNDRLASVYGMTREQIQGRNVRDLVVPEMQDEAKKRILTAATGPTRWPVCTAGGQRTMVNAVTTIEILNGQPMRVTRGWEAVADSDGVNGIPATKSDLRQGGSTLDGGTMPVPR